MRRIQCIAAIDLRRLGVALPHLLLDRAKRHTLWCELRAEGVAQVMECERRQAGALQRLLEALAHLLWIQRFSGLRTAEDEISIGVEGRALEVAL